MFVRTRNVLVIGGLFLSLAACGGGSDTAGSSTSPVGSGAADPSTDSNDAGESSGEATESDRGCRSGLGCADGLIDELSAVPVPSNVDEFSSGDVIEQTGTASQTLFFDDSTDNLVAFYEMELPAAGFDVTDFLDTTPSSPGGETFSVTGPDGREGKVVVTTAATHDSQIKLTFRLEPNP